VRTESERVLAGDERPSECVSMPQLQKDDFKAFRVLSSAFRMF
jgi:hypothetical protein